MDIVFKIIAGSRLYGTYNENSDYDYRGVFLPEYDSYFGFKQKDIVESNNNGEDVVLYSIRKFMTLAMACNPNIIEWLYAPEENILELHPAGQALVNMRFKLLNKRYIRDRFFGFSNSEMYKFINNKSNVKSIAHYIRLLYEAIELLEYGALTFPRPEVILLNDIRNNKMVYDEIVDIVKNLQNELNDKYDNCIFLPDTTDTKKIEEDIIEIIKKHTRR